MKGCRDGSLDISAIQFLSKVKEAKDIEKNKKTEAYGFNKDNR